MKQKELEMMFELEKANELEWQGHCHDCKIDVTKKRKGIAKNEYRKSKSIF
jgi:hypothetical protein